VKHHNFFLASYPRTGNTFTRLLLEHHFGISTVSPYRASSPLKGPLASKLNRDAPESRLWAYKTHERRHVSHNPALVVVRHPLDTLVSRAHYAQVYEGDPGPFEEALECVWRRDKWVGWYVKWLEDWGGHISDFVRYEDLLKDGVETLRAALGRILRHEPPVLTSEPLPPFSDFHAETPRFFRKGRAGAWREEVPEEHWKRLWAPYAAVAKAYGYEDPK